MMRDKDKRRRLDKLGAGKPVTEMTDAELLAEWTTDPTAPTAPKPTGSPMQQWIASLSDADLLALHAETQAELAATEAEHERRRPTPEPVVELLTPVAEPPEPHPIALEPTPAKPPPPTPPGAHVSIPLEGCDCLSCSEHRLAAWREERDRALIAASENEPMVGEVILGSNATPALRAALRGHQR